MIKPIKLTAIALLALSFASCKMTEEESTWKEYAEWRELNTSYINEQENLMVDGKHVYEKIAPVWNENAYILMRIIQRDNSIKNPLTPLYTSTVDVRYYVRLYDNEPVDSSYTSTSPAEGISRFRLNNVIPCWTIAMEHMQVGDSVEIITPYDQAYGASTTHGKIKPYSTLKFNIRLVDIAGEYILP